MKCSETWLREWVNPPLTREQLCQTLTMSGFEIDEVRPVAQPFSGIVIGQIIRIQKHPEADRLHICEVDVNGPRHITIVSGAENIKTGMKTAVATVNATLANHTTITATELRGITSEGMLCSARELGVEQEKDPQPGVYIFPPEVPVGQSVWTYLTLEDHVLDIAITPNRGDCLSIKGMAREIAALTHSPLHPIKVPEVKATLKDSLPISIQSPSGCPRYLGRIIRNVKADAATPSWLQERLRRCGVRSISPIVDVTNYVMLELGQPMHAFDLNTIQQGIVVRSSKAGERLTLLDGSDTTLDAETLVIADQEKPLAIAGVMGGLDSSVTLLTTDILLESAYFSPHTVSRQRQYYGLTSESAYRFERGVDPTQQKEAMERATELITSIAGGKAGPVLEVKAQDFDPAPRMILLTAKKLEQVLGVAIPASEVETIFKAFQWTMKSDKKNQQWQVYVPPYRFDLQLPEDLIEEIARVYGYENIPAHALQANLEVNDTERESAAPVLKQSFKDQGYHEIVSYSFIEKALQAQFDTHHTPTELINPITADMTVMRTTLWPGLITALKSNLSRQQHRVRLFEVGTCFITQENQLQQPLKLAGLISGLAYKEQWGVTSREVDFYDLKGDLTQVLSKKIEFKPDTHTALHPGQTAGIYYQGQRIGLCGALHPQLLQALDLPNKVFMFELTVAPLDQAFPKRWQEISKFPEIRRDIALVVNHAIPAKAIQDTIAAVAGEWLKEVFIFDVYQGKGIAPDLKSIALALILQHPTRTLVDDEVAALVERVIVALKGQLGAELRS